MPNGSPTTYFFVIDGNGGAECDFTLEVSNVIALPVEFINFEVEKLPKVNLVKWQTAAEVNVSHFEVERSLNGVDFHRLGVLPAQGNSSSNMEYEFADEDILHSRSYYRIVSVDYDGKKQKSAAVAVNRKFDEIIFEANVFPNPSDGAISVVINSSLDQNVRISLYNALGELIFSEFESCSQGRVVFDYGLKSLPSGVYNLTVEGDFNNQVMKLLIK